MHHLIQVFVPTKNLNLVNSLRLGIVSSHIKSIMMIKNKILDHIVTIVLLKIKLYMQNYKLFILGKQARAKQPYFSSITS